MIALHNMKFDRPETTRIRIMAFTEANMRSLARNYWFLGYYRLKFWFWIKIFLFESWFWMFSKLFGYRIPLGLD